MAKTPTKPAPSPAAKPRKPHPGPGKGDKHWRTHKPTEQTRAAVQALNALGVTLQEICEYLSKMMGAPVKSPNSLRKHYATELAMGKTHQKLVVSQGLYRQAVGAPAVYDASNNLLRAETKPNLTAQIFWLKCQAGWVEPQRIQHAGDPDQPIPISFANLSDKQLEQLLARMEEALAAASRR